VHSYRGTNAAWAAWTGNHDNLMWSTPGGHQDRLLARMALNNATSYCAGEVGVEQICNYKGLQVALTGVGSRRTPEEGTAFLDTTFATYPNIWRVAMWHKNQLLYQTGPWTCVPAWFFLCAYAHVYLFACKVWLPLIVVWPGSKLNGVGWGVYEASLKHGAIVMTGKHGYTAPGAKGRPMLTSICGPRDRPRA
jgi:hypothetical protein